MSPHRRHQHPAIPAAVPAASTAPGHVLCPYCANQIAVADFTPWTMRSGLVSAGCRCGRTVTMATLTLNRRTA